MRVLLDTDVVLDLLLDRNPFSEAAVASWQANREGRLEVYISAITPLNVFYIARKLKGADTARQAVKELLTGLRICAVDQATLQIAVASSLTDYEDAVQHANATTHHLDAIVTRNLEDYRGATVAVFSPTDFLVELKKRESGPSPEDNSSS
jgi:predicted nucleic acid-binding protein